MNETSNVLKIIIRLFVLSMMLFGLSVVFYQGSPSQASAQTEEDTTAPTVSSVAVTNDTGDDGVYGIGDRIEVTVTFSENVAILGNPQLELTIGNSARNAAYRSTTGSSVVFSYTVAVGDSDTDGISIAADKINLKGGAIKDLSGNSADLSHSAVATQSGHKVDGIRPTITGVYYESATSAQDAHTVGTNLSVFAYFSENVYVGGYPGPRMKLNFEGTSKSADFWGAIPQCERTICVSGPGKRRGIKLAFYYEIVRGDLDLDGVAVDANSLVLNGGRIRDGAGNDAVLTHSAVAEDPDHIVDGVPPTIRSVVITSNPGSDNTYGVGDTIEVTVTFSESVRVPQWFGSGEVRMPRLELNIGGAARSARTHERASITGTAVVFQYTVQDGDDDADGISVGANKLSLNRGTITDDYDCCPGANNADLHHSAVADDSRHKVATSAPPKSTDATLSALTLSGIDIGTFAPGTTSYTAQVTSSVSQTTVTPTVNHPGASYVIKLGGVTDSNGVIPLGVGSNVITIEVTAEDTTATRSYTVTVTRAASTDATLSGLSLSDVDFGTFASGTTSYTAHVASSVTETNVTPTLNHSGASHVIKLGGVTDADGVIPLEAGDNVITIDVTAEDDETTKTYTVTVTRAPAVISAPDLTLPFVYTSKTKPFVYSPLFTLGVNVVNEGNDSSGSTTLHYYRSADSTITDGDTEVGTDAVGSLAASGRSIEAIDLTAPSAPGTYYYGACVDAVSNESDTTNNCSAGIAWVVPETSTDATLSGLTLSDVNFGTFASSTTSYSAQVANSVSQTTVTPTKNHSGASYVIKLDGVTDTDGVISLSVGSNVITVEVTAEDGQTSRTYTVTLTRLASIQQESTDATLSALTLSGIEFGTFRSGMTSYSAHVANSVTETTVTPTVNDSGASYVIKLDGVTDPDGTLSLAVGSNVITVVVTAEDETTIETYTVTVTRSEPLSTDATLKSLSIDDVEWSRLTLEYITVFWVTFDSSVTQATVRAVVNHPGASYVLKVDGVVDDDGVVPVVRVSAPVKPSITIEVTAEDEETTRTYDLSPRRMNSTDATLSALTLSGIDYGTFSSGTTSYTATVAYSVTETTVMPTGNQPGTSYVIKLDGVSDADGTVFLSVGANVITVEVTAEDDRVTSTYTVTVTRAEPPSTDATLKALTLSRVNFGTFDSTTTSYSARVANSVRQTTVRPTVNDSGASYVIKLGGVTDADGTVSLAVGANVITVEVTAEDGSTTQTYRVTVTRAEPPSTDATLKGLTLSEVDFGIFDSTTTSYSTQVANSLSQTTVTPVVNDSGASRIIKIGGVTDADGTVPLAVGSNVITVEVTAEDDSTTQTYTVTVTRAEPPSTDATLKGLTLSDVNFGTFSSATTSYTAQVANSVTQTTVTPTVNDSGASHIIKIGGVTDADGKVSLSVGTSVITVVVTAEDGVTTRTYTVTVTRAESSTSEKSSDATLKSLALSGIDFGTFDSTTTSYSTQVSNSVSQTIVTPAANAPGASYVIKLGGVIIADGKVSLDVGNNVITVDVAAEDGETTKTYTITVTRTEPPSTDATLSTLTLSEVNFGTFVSGTRAYTASVANSVSRTKVTPSVNHSGASFVIKLGGVTDADGTVSLSVGINVITVTVTAQDRQTTRTYTLTVTRAEPLSSDATLRALTLSGVDFGTFDSSTITYRAQVANGVLRTTVTPSVSSTGASYVIKLGGVTDVDGTVSLSVGSNVITIVVAAQDGSTTRTYTVTVTRASENEQPPRSDAPVTGELPTDDPKVNFRVSGYAHDRVDIAWAVPQNRSITKYVVQRYEHDGSGFVSSGTGEGSRFEGTTSGGDEHSQRNTHVQPDTLYQYVLKLNNDTGTTIIESASTVRTLSSDATLSALTLSEVDFGTFDSETTSYSADVANDASETTVTPTLNDSAASYVIKLGGVTDADGTVSLAVGSNVITVEVTAEDGETTLTYTVTITREEISLLTGELASDDPPVNFRITRYDDSQMGLAWEIPNNRGITGYVLERYDHDGTEFVSSDWSVSSTMAGGDSATESSADLTADSRYRYDLVLASDTGTVIIENSQEVRTLAAGAAALSSDATLSALSLSGAELDPGFTSAAYSYTGSVVSDVTQTTVTATPNDTAAGYVVKLGGAVDADGAVDLTPGRNVITVHVTAEDGVTTRIYTVLVTRAKTEDALSSDASLRSLSLNGIDFGTFYPDTTAYTAQVANDVTQTTVTPVRNDVEATHVIEVGGAEDEDRVIDLAEGENVITVEVTAEDGETTRTYMVTVTRAEAPAPEPTPDPEPTPEPADTCIQSIGADGAITGSWDDTCLSEKDAPGGAGARYARFYTFTLTEATDIVINLSSDEDTYLYLLNGHGKSGDTLHSNDDIAGGGVNLNSRLSVTLQAGDYTIEATTYSPETSGAFTLTIAGLSQAEAPAPDPQPEPAPDPEPEVDACAESVDADGTIEGSWDDTCLSDRAALSGTGDRYSRFYTFTLDESADVTITLMSDEDTYLYLLSGHGRNETVLYEEDDIDYPSNTNSRLAETLQAGDYTIEATTYYADKSGEFTLTIEGLVTSP